MGTFDRPNFGVSAHLAWTPLPVRIELDGTYWLTQTVTLPPRPPNPPRGAKLDFMSLGLLGCYALVRSPVELSPCAGAELGSFSAAAFGVAENGKGSALFSSMRLGGLVAFPLGPFALRATLEGIAPLSRPSFQIGFLGEVHKPAPIGARAGVGAELRF